MRRKAIALVSGGLDSLLAARVIADQGIEVRGVCFVMPFASRDISAFKGRVREACADAGISVSMVDISEEFLQILERPEHRFGSNLNPCIDCKILMLRRAREIMEKEDAAFIITGEVLGERPMSQRKDALNRIEKKSLLDGYLLRPLSARLLKVTVPEKEGIVDRDALFDIQGRSRERQFKLAEEYGIREFFSPGGGCLLTDPEFSRRLGDLMGEGGLKLDDIKLLKYGRHFRLDDGTKVVVGRNEKDNAGIAALKKDHDVLLRLKEKTGPCILLRGQLSPLNIEKAASLCVSHSKSRNSRLPEKIRYWTDVMDARDICADPLAMEEIEAMRV
ncbi:MAG: tRNA 4-thiouridine(8) synthase ThiI [Candidatus Omnitrophica bacterium]|nr:tRNA 4-thiouridine(8) synthase ThiI [Candidatus Omnitrophota bacterium]